MFKEEFHSAWIELFLRLISAGDFSSSQVRCIVTTSLSAAAAKVANEWRWVQGHPYAWPAEDLLLTTITKDSCKTCGFFEDRLLPFVRVSIGPCTSATSIPSKKAALTLRSACLFLCAAHAQSPS